MHNPLVLLKKDLLDAMIASGNQYFIRQSYPRGKDPFDEKIKEAFLISHYNDLHKAEAHYQAVAQDYRKFFYHVGVSEEKAKLYLATEQPEGFKIYANILPDQWTPSKQMGAKIRSYIDGVLKWRVSRNSRVNAALFSEFGELYIKIRNGSHEVKIPLKDIERR